MRLRSPAAAAVLLAAVLAGTALYRRRSTRRAERVELYADDGSMVALADGSARRRPAALARPRPARARGLMTVPGTAALAQAIREAALLEGDFLLRSGKRSSYYLDKYRFGTRPDLLRALGVAIAAAVREHEPDAVRLAAPELGAVPLAAAASLEAELPFVIVRKEAKEYGTGNRIEGRVRARRAGLPRRGRRHLGRGRARRGRGAARGRPARLHRDLRRRPRGGRRRRPRPGGRSAPPALPRLGGPDRRVEGAWLSDIRSRC